MIERKKTKRIVLGNVPVGGGEPISVQTMTNTKTSDIKATLEQIGRIECARCDILRVAVPDEESAHALRKIVKETKMPVVADIHFDWRLALLAMENGADGIRVNPGTIASRKGLKEIAKEASQRGVVVRVGVNSGSLEKEFRVKRDGEAGALVQSALKGVTFFEDAGVNAIKVSVKATSVPVTIQAYRMISKECEWPLHIGVTEAGTIFSGSIRSAVGIGALLAEGIGDTIRVSLSADPVEEVRVGLLILKTLGLAPPSPWVVSCPTCARCEIDVIGIASELERRLEGIEGSLRVAVMGCSVNGPGEAREADLGIAGGRVSALIFKGGKIIAKVPKEHSLEALVTEVEKILKGESGERG